MVKQIEKVGRFFDYILCESHLVLREGKLVKDFMRLGRDQRKMIVIDCVPP